MATGKTLELLFARRQANLSAMERCRVPAPFRRGRDDEASRPEGWSGEEALP
jgi:hypothetical protein